MIPKQAEGGEHLFQGEPWSALWVVEKQLTCYKVFRANIEMGLGGWPDLHLWTFLQSSDCNKSCLFQSCILFPLRKSEKDRKDASWLALFTLLLQLTTQQLLPHSLYFVFLFSFSDIFTRFLKYFLSSYWKTCCEVNHFSDNLFFFRRSMKL